MQIHVRNTTHIETFEVCLETDVVAIKAIDHESDIIRCHGVVGHKVGRDIHLTMRKPFGEEIVGERVEREVSTNMVSGRVNADLAFEPSGVDLEVVFWVTPTAESRRGVVPDRRVFDIVSVWVEVRL